MVTRTEGRTSAVREEIDYRYASASKNISMLHFHHLHGLISAARDLAASAQMYTECFFTENLHVESPLQITLSVLSSILTTTVQMLPLYNLSISLSRACLVKFLTFC